MEKEGISEVGSMLLIFILCMNDATKLLSSLCLPCTSDYFL